MCRIQIVGIIVLLAVQIYGKLTFEEYLREREEFIRSEENRFLGAGLYLSEEENIVNQYIMKLKQAELDRGFYDSYNFISARHFFETLDRINDSVLYQFIRRLPKGGVLHSHTYAIESNECLLNATYRDNLWQKGGFERESDPIFLFSKYMPDGEGWRLVSEIHSQIKPAVYDAKIMERFSLYVTDPIDTYKNLDMVWERFEKIFNFKIPLLLFKPVWRQCYWDTLQRFHDDKINYFEFRVSAPKIYNLDGSILPVEEVIQNLIDDTEKFKTTHPEFLGVKMIYTPGRFLNNAIVEEHLNNVKTLHDKFPDFIVGFDFDGQEDLGRPLLDFVPMLLQLPESIKFFFHAGETNWFGMKTDFNMIDAILLGTKRIGHGFALVKHPKLLEELKRRRICVEVNPISNQVLKLVEDYRNHPAAVLFSDNYPMVISSDDPAMWKASPLSHDFYMAFLGIASAHQDLRLIKQLALNSIEYSAMRQAEKDDARDKWLAIWNDAIKEIAEVVLKKDDNRINEE